MPPHYEIVALGQAIVDQACQIPEQLFERFALQRGQFHLLPPERHAQLQRDIGHLPSEISAGGSVANSIAAIGELGGRGALITRVGQDLQGELFLRDMRRCSVTTLASFDSTAPTAHSLILVHGDGERTMATCIGAASSLPIGAEAQGSLRQCDWILAEGFLLDGVLPQLFDEIGSWVGAPAPKVALTLGNEGVVEREKAKFERALDSTALLLANLSEARAFLGVDDPLALASALGERVPQVALTRGAQGCIVVDRGEVTEVSAFPASVVDTTGAGDLFAGALLFGLLRGLPLPAAARRANFLAAQLVGQQGARFRGDLKALWNKKEVL